MSADNAIAILRTRSTRGAGHYEYRLAEYGVSGEPFMRTRATSVSDEKGLDTVAMQDLFPDGVRRWDEVDPLALAAAEETMVVVDGFVAITFHCAQGFTEMFARSPVFTNARDAHAEATRMEEEDYVEYGSECVFIDATWEELLAQAEVVRKRRLNCLVRGPRAREERIGNIDARADFKYLGNPGIEDKLERWSWPADVVQAVMAKVNAKFWNTRDADNLRLAREGNAAEMERFARTKAKGCCQSHEESFVVESEEGQVRVHFGFNFGH